jgi:hypothetical protein
MINAPISRPSIEHALLVRTLNHEDKRRIGPGLPVRRFVHPILRSEVATRDGDLYAAAGWTETTRRPR